MKRAVYAAFALLLLAGECRAGHNEDDDAYTKLREDLIAQGATPEQLELIATLHNSSRPTLVCLCHHEANVTTCGVDGHLYLNECAARCRHVKVACVGDDCEDCDHYGPDGSLENKVAHSVPAESPEDATPEDKRTKKEGRRFLAVS